MDKAKVRTPKQKSRLNCRQLYNSIYQYRNIDGVQLIDMFMHKPSKRDYPDYYDVSNDCSMIIFYYLHFIRFLIKVQSKFVDYWVFLFLDYQ